MEKSSNIYSPPDRWFNGDGPLVYLAGAPELLWNWHDRAIESLIASNPKLSIADPRSTKPADTDEEWHLQVEWEVYHIRIASAQGAVMFWVSDYMTTQDIWQLSEWVANYKYRQILDPERKLRLVIGMEDDCKHAKYIKHRLSQDLAGFHIYKTIEDTCKAVLEALK